MNNIRQFGISKFWAIMTAAVIGGFLAGVLTLSSEESHAQGSVDIYFGPPAAPLVSADFKGNPASSIVDGLATMVIDGNLIKAIAWYDNEWGFACRLSDLCAFLADQGL